VDGVGHQPDLVIEVLDDEANGAKDEKSNSIDSIGLLRVAHVQEVIHGGRHQRLQSALQMQNIKRKSYLKNRKLYLDVHD
jgi:hypothetical protein